MSCRTIRVVVTSGLLLGVVCTAAAAPAEDDAAFFESRVRPLLVAKCQGCHGDKVAEAGLRLDSRRSLLAGSDTGPVVSGGGLGVDRRAGVVC